MNESERLADQITKALNGGAWHGPSWREALEGVTPEAALQRPIPEAHSIGEILLHAATWHDVVRRRIEGETPEVSDAQDWPVAKFADESAWKAAVSRLFETGSALAETVRCFPAETLQDKRPGVDGTWYDLIIGELQHVLYHAGQVALLKKASVRVPV
jgi:uncharacterized damage-inducible protein DinB